MQPPDHTGQILTLLQTSSKLDYIGEPISQLEHALQAGHFAEKAGAETDEILAALLHDVGHYCGVGSIDDMGGYGVKSHEDVGAAYLARLGLPVSVTELVAGHVAAKRYLVARNTAYAARLSQASRRTLEYQGGAMSDAEADAFERAPGFRSILRVRQWDEQAKVPGLAVAGLEHYRERLAARIRGAT